jgi:hypothetical protein
LFLSPREHDSTSFVVSPAARPTAPFAHTSVLPPPLLRPVSHSRGGGVSLPSSSAPATSSGARLNSLPFVDIFDDFHRKVRSFVITEALCDPVT